VGYYLAPVNINKINKTHLQNYKPQKYIFAEGKLGFLAFIRKAKKIKIQKIL
jgi:uncharacterized membrane protein YqiK